MDLSYLAPKMFDVIVFGSRSERSNLKLMTALVHM